MLPVCWQAFDRSPCRSLKARVMHNRCATDLALAPRLYHTRVALGHYKGWKIPDNLTAVHEYIKLWEGRPSWTKTYYPESAIIAGWAAHK